MSQDPIDAYDAYLNDMDDIESGSLSHSDFNFEANILCENCQQISVVGGSIWAGRLRSSRQETMRHPASGVVLTIYRGWNCDPCADRFEQGLDGY